MCCDVVDEDEDLPVRKKNGNRGDMIIMYVVDILSNDVIEKMGFEIDLE